MKKTIVFMNIFSHGHTNPTLGLVKKLVDDGNIVYYYSFDEFRDKIVSTGAIFKSYKNYPLNFDNAILTKNISCSFLHFIFSTYCVLDYLFEELYLLKPNVIVYDSFCFWGKIIADKLGIPGISTITFYPIISNYLKCKIILKEFIKVKIVDIINLFKITYYFNRIKSKYHLRDYKIFNCFINSSKNNIVFSLQEFIDSKNHKENYYFIGPCISNRKENCDELKINNYKDIVLVSLGTILNVNYRFYNNCIKSLMNHNGTIIINIGNKSDKSKFINLPSKFVIVNFIDQIKLLKKTKLFITQGGMNSVNEGLFFGVPMIAFPLNFEQKLVANYVSQNGCGVLLKKNNSKDLIKSIELITNNYSYYKNNCIKYSNVLKQNNSSQNGVNIIYKILNNN